MKCNFTNYAFLCGCNAFHCPPCKGAHVYFYSYDDRGWMAYVVLRCDCRYKICFCLDWKERTRKAGVFPSKSKLRTAVTSATDQTE